jgi:hypothetical protein
VSEKTTSFSDGNESEVRKWKGVFSPLISLTFFEKRSVQTSIRMVICTMSGDNQAAPVINGTSKPWGSWD